MITDHWLLCLVLLLLTLVTGCRLLQKAANVPGQAVHAVTPGNKDKHVADPVEVQQQLLRFADEYSMRMIIGVDNLRSCFGGADWMVSYGPPDPRKERT